MYVSSATSDVDVWINILTLFTLLFFNPSLISLILLIYELYVLFNSVKAVDVLPVCVDIVVPLFVDPVTVVSPNKVTMSILSFAVFPVNNLNKSLPKSVTKFTLFPEYAAYNCEYVWLDSTSELPTFGKSLSK